MSDATERAAQNNGAIEPVIGHPLYDSTVQDAGVNPEDLIAYYKAGYLVIMGPDDSVLREMLDLPEDIVLTADFSAPMESSAPGNPDYQPDLTLENGDDKGARGVPSPTTTTTAAAAAAPPAQIVRKLFAKLENGQAAYHLILGTDLPT